jgi:hypothetical protein
MLSHSTSLRLAAKIQIDPSGCWLWIAAKDTHGYGRFWDGERLLMAHRVTHENRFGPIPTGLQSDHLCRVRACVNPDHIEPVTPKENTLRGNGPSAIAARKTHCIHGHEFSTNNTRVYRGKRHCRTCRRAYNARGKQRRKKI